MRDSVLNEVVEPCFAPFFLAKLLGKHNSYYDLQSLDPVTQLTFLSVVSILHPVWALAAIWKMSIGVRHVPPKALFANLQQLKTYSQGHSGTARAKRYQKGEWPMPFVLWAKIE